MKIVIGLAIIALISSCTAKVSDEWVTLEWKNGSITTSEEWVSIDWKENWKLEISEEWVEIDGWKVWDIAENKVMEEIDGILKDFEN